jgi:hypothetical protein
MVAQATARPVKPTYAELKFSLSSIGRCVLVFLKRGLRIYRLSIGPDSAHPLASNQESDMRILEKIGAYFEACSESFVSEGQAYAMLREKRRAAGAMQYRPPVLTGREVPAP